MKFDTWLDTMIDEKNLDRERVYTFGDNYIPLECIIENIKMFDSDTKMKVKNTLIKIDYRNGDILHFFKYIGEKMAIPSFQGLTSPSFFATMVIVRKTERLT